MVVRVFSSRRGGYALWGFLVGAIPWWIYFRLFLEHHNPGGEIGCPVLGVSFGVAGLFLFLKSVDTYRTMANIPTSKIRSLAMGLVELSGKAEKAPCLKGPFTGSDCAYYEYAVEEHRSSGKNSRWVTILSGSSKAVPFLLNDATGKVIVDPQEAEISLSVGYQQTFGGILGTDIPSALDKFLATNGKSASSFFGSRRLRFTESLVALGQTLYVIGTTRKMRDPVAEKKTKLNERLQALKHDADFMKKADVNQDGTVDATEWDAAVRSVEEELLRKELAEPVDPDPLDVVIGKSDSLNIISADPERKLLFRYKLAAAVCFLAVLSNAALAGFCWIKR